MSEDTGADEPQREQANAGTETGAQAPGKGLSAAAQRALAEAAERRRKAAQSLPSEVNGRGGLEPVRYGDWEIKGIASDF